MEFLIKLKKKKRKKEHLLMIHDTIAALHNEVINSAAQGIAEINKAKLLKKYNRRLQLILF